MTTTTPEDDDDNDRELTPEMKAALRRLRGISADAVASSGLAASLEAIRKQQAMALAPSVSAVLREMRKQHAKALSPSVSAVLQEMREQQAKAVAPSVDAAVRSIRRQALLVSPTLAPSLEALREQQAAAMSPSISEILASVRRQARVGMTPQLDAALNAVAESGLAETESGESLFSSAYAAADEEAAEVASEAPGLSEAERAAAKPVVQTLAAALVCLYMLGLRLTSDEVTTVVLHLLDSLGVSAPVTTWIFVGRIFDRWYPPPHEES